MVVKLPERLDSDLVHGECMSQGPVALAECRASCHQDFDRNLVGANTGQKSRDRCFLVDLNCGVSSVLRAATAVCITVIPTYTMTAVSWGMKWEAPGRTARTLSDQYMSAAKRAWASKNRGAVALCKGVSGFQQRTETHRTLPSSQEEGDGCILAPWGARHSVRDDSNEVVTLHQKPCLGHTWLAGGAGWGPVAGAAV